MIRLTIAEIREGQVLAQDIMRGDGVVLLSKGQTISQEVINLLSRLEVDSVLVEGDLFESEEDRQAFFKAQEDALEERFARVRDDRELMELKERFRRQITKGCAVVPAKATQRSGKN